VRALISWNSSLATRAIGTERWVHFSEVNRRDFDLRDLGEKLLNVL
jgi:hypothetical protein